jgi:hypothetical protein
VDWIPSSSNFETTYTSAHESAEEYTGKFNLWYSTIRPTQLSTRKRHRHISKLYEVHDTVSELWQEDESEFMSNLEDFKHR